MTIKREAVYNIIQHSPIPLTAADIHKQISISIDIATVYRNLNYLEKEEKIVSFFFTCSNRGGERYYYREQTPHVHFFHCHSCHTFIPLGNCNVSKMEQNLEKSHDIKIDKHTLYFTGYCHRCR